VEDHVATLTDEQIAQALASLPDWTRVGTTIERTVRFPAFMDGVRFIEAVANLAEAADHHPDIDIRYRNVRFVLSTHSEGGLTAKDVDMARQINRALENVPTSPA
jgi:4a-hydroxytetrahydrobiopterin dehydratase